MEGNGSITGDENSVELNAGKTVLLPACLGEYNIYSEKGIKLLRVTVWGKFSFYEYNRIKRCT